MINRVLIVSSNGRCGTTAIQDMFSSMIGNSNVGEICDIEDITEQNYIAKYIIRDNYNKDHTSLIQKIDPTFIVFNFREHLFSQFISLCMAKKLNIWDQSRSPNIGNTKFKLSNVEYKISEFFDYVIEYEKIKTHIDNLYKDRIKFSISYETIFSGNLEKIGFPHPATSIQFNNLNKNDIIINISEVKEKWMTISNQYHSMLSDKNYNIKSEI